MALRSCMSHEARMAANGELHRRQLGAIVSGSLLSLLLYYRLWAGTRTMKPQREADGTPRPVVPAARYAPTSHPQTSNRSTQKWNLFAKGWCVGDGNTSKEQWAKRLFCYLYFYCLLWVFRCCVSVYTKRHSFALYEAGMNNING